MSPTNASIPDERPLTAAERVLARWMLDHGESGAEAFLPQLARARVVSRCPCGCASIDFAIEGEPAPSGGLRILGDFLYGPASSPMGVFAFERGGVLAGIEVWSPMGDETPRTLPVPEALRAWDRSVPQEQG